MMMAFVASYQGSGHGDWRETETQRLSNLSPFDSELEFRRGYDFRPVTVAAVNL